MAVMWVGPGDAGRIWIPEAPRATEFSGSDCREQVEGQEQGPFPIESKMPRIPGGVRVTTGHLERRGQDLPPLSRWSEWGHTEEEESAHPLISALFFFSKTMLHAGAWVQIPALSLS